MTEISREIISVGDLNRAIAELLDGQIGSVWLRGEISNFKAYDSGHWYFSLKDSESQIRAVMFRGRNTQVGFMPKEGDLVEVSAQVSVYIPRGDLQINVQLLRRAGQGGLYEAFLKLKEKLAKEGLFAEERKREIAAHPKGIAVVTSAQAAALKDVLSTLARRAPHIPVTIFPTLVQGADAPPAIIGALQSVYEQADALGIETILLVRGGGSIEDLWAFNDEALARVIASSPVPIISGVGHETDFTISDFVADLRAPTPTGAAELATPDREALLQDLNYYQERIARRIRQVLDREVQRLDQMQMRLQHAIPNPQQMRERKDALEARLHQAWRVLAKRHTTTLDHLGKHLEILNPQRTLDRGYAVLLDEQGHAQRNPQNLRTQTPYELRLADGLAEVQLQEIVARKTEKR